MHQINWGYLVINEENIVQQAINGNQFAFTRIYDEYFTKVYRYIYSLVGNQTEAEDLAQDVFIKALHAIGSYKFKGAPFSAWLFRIAHNQVIDYWRKQKKEKTTTLDEAITVTSENNPVTMIEQMSELEELTTALKKIPEAQGEVVSLRFISGLSIAEVAESLGKREGTIKALQFKGIASLKKIIPER